MSTEDSNSTVLRSRAEIRSTSGWLTGVLLLRKANIAIRKTPLTAVAHLVGVQENWWRVISLIRRAATGVISSLSGSSGSGKPWRLGSRLLPDTADAEPP